MKIRGTDVHSSSVACLKNRLLAVCNWLPAFPPPWNWLPVVIVTEDTGVVGKRGSRIPGRPRGSGLAGICHALPRLTMLRPPSPGRRAASRFRVSTYMGARRFHARYTQLLLSGERRALTPRVRHRTARHTTPGLQTQPVP